MAIVIIYALCDPDTKECRYIGKANDLESRIRCHRWEALSSSLHTHKVNWLRSLSSDPLVEVLEITDTDNWQDAERQWISKMREQNNKLTNFAAGGQTSPIEGIGHTEESKEKMRATSIRLGLKPPSRAGCVPWNKGVHTGISPYNKGKHKEFCPHGHMLEGDNIEIAIKKSENRKYYRCRTCHHIQQKAYLIRQKGV